MFRRRPPRRPFMGGGRPEIPPMLQRANQLLESGQYAEAASAFEQLAEGALARRGPRAPVFFLQAGRARTLNSEPAAGLGHFKRGLQLFAEHGAFHRVHKAGSRVIAELRARGFTAEAQQMEEFVKGLLPAGTSPTAAHTPDENRHAVLPTHCPSCGAGLKPDEVEWLDEVTAECDYCGSPVRATSRD